jgi:hypothetical protein
MNANDGIDAMFKLIIECSIKIRLGNKIKINEDTVYEKFQSNWAQIFPPRTCLKSYLAEIELSQKKPVVNQPILTLFLAFERRRRIWVILYKEVWFLNQKHRVNHHEIP